MSELVDQKTVDVIDVSPEVRNIIEALIFASDEPVSPRLIRTIVDEANKDSEVTDQISLDSDIIKKAVAELNRGYGRVESSFRIIQIAGGYTYATTENFSSWVGKLAKEKARRRLSVTAVETLAIIAYKQPITKVEVEFIRGVNVDYIMKALLEKDLIYISGRAHTPGRPLLYGTTEKFLEHFGLNDIADLPKPREIEELIGETEAEVDKRLLAEQQELEFREELGEKLEGHEGSKQRSGDRKQPRVRGKQVPSPQQRESTESPSAPHNEKISPAEDGSKEVVLPVEPPSPAGQANGEPRSVDIPDVHAPEEIAASGEAEEEKSGKSILSFSEKGTESSNSRGIIENENLSNEDQIKNRQRVNEPEPSDMPVDRVQAVDSNPEEHAADRDPLSDEETRGNRWSKWKNKVKSFFQKIFG